MPINDMLCYLSIDYEYDIISPYTYSVNGTEITHTLTKHCSYDDVACLNNWLAQHPANTTIQGWYDTLAPYDGVSFSYPEKPVDMVWINTITNIFTIGAIAIVIVAIIGIRGAEK